MNEKGRLCEDLVVQYLMKDNYEIVARNYRSKLGEVDIIARFQGVLCFVEVKSLTGCWDRDQLVRMVDGKKRRRIQLTAIDYLNKVEWQGEQQVIRFDVASVTNGRVAYYEGVF